MNNDNPIVKVTEPIFGLIFIVDNNSLSEIVRALNLELKNNKIISGTKYKKIINDHGGFIPTGYVDDKFAMKADDYFDSRVMWVYDDNNPEVFEEAIAKIIVPKTLKCFKP